MKIQYIFDDLHVGQLFLFKDDYNSIYNIKYDKQSYWSLSPDFELTKHNSSLQKEVIIYNHELIYNYFNYLIRTSIQDVDLQKELKEFVCNFQDVSFSLSDIISNQDDYNYLKLQKVFEKKLENLLHNKIDRLNESVNNEKQKIVEHESKIVSIQNLISKIQNTCKHSSKELFPDPSGNNGSFERCTICLKEDKKL